MEFESAFEEFDSRDWEPASGDDRIRYAVVGCGWFPQEFALPAIDAGELCETTVLVSGDREKRERVAEQYGIDRSIGYDAFHDGEATDVYDAVYVCTPNRTHLEHVTAAAELGKDVLCEKPLEVNPDRTERLIAACEDADVTLMTAYRQQAEPGLRRLRTLLQEGLIGTPVHATGNFSITLLGRDADTDQWRLDPEMAGGGALVDIGIYPLNTVRFLLGADPVAVQAETRVTDDRYEGLDEHIRFLLSFDGALSATATASYGAHLDDRLTLVGTDGKVTIEPAFYPEVERRFRIERDGVTVEVGDATSGIAEEFEYFANCLLTGTQPDPDGQDGLFDARAVEALYESADTGRRVELS